MKRSLHLALLALFVVALPVAAQDFNWRGRIGRGQTLEIKGVNGDIRAVAARGAEARVAATKVADDDDPDEVQIEVVEHANGITICAVYPSRRGRQPNTCEPADRGRIEVRDNDVKVNFEVQVPAGVMFVARNVNGDVEVTDVPGDVRAITVNGGVEVSADGMVEARAVNGDIHARMGNPNWDGRVEFESVNGTITLEIVGQLDAEVEASTVNGDISTDYPLTVRGRFGPKRVTGTVGRGGRTLALSTVNGSIEIRRVR